MGGECEVNTSPGIRLKMGAFIPIAFIIVAVLASSAAVYVAITTVALVAIILAIVAVSATIASIYYYSQGDIKNSMLFAAIGIAAGIGGVYLAAAGDMATAAALTEEGTQEALAAAAQIQAGVAVQTWTYATSIYEGFNTFLEAIHFKILLEIHQIAYLISTDYRNFMTQIWGAVSKYSDAIGLGGTFMYLALRDTRNLVMDTSALLGNKYDMAEVTWISSLSEYFKSIGDKGQEYAAHPEALIWDLDQSLHRPAVDMMGETARMIYKTLNAVVTSAQTLTMGAKAVETDLKRLVADLPSAITRGFKPELDKLWKYTDDFIRLSYDPAMKMISGAMTSFGDKMTETRGELTGVVGRLKRPGKYIAEVDDLSAEERMEDQEVLAAVATRGITPQLDEFEEGLKFVQGEFTRQIEEQAIVEEPTTVASPEPGVPSTPGAPRKKVYKTPFVGEY